MKFPISIIKRMNGLQVQEIEYSGQLTAGPFITDYLQDAQIWTGLYSSSAILPVFSSSSSVIVTETPVASWLDKSLPCDEYALDDVGFIFHTSRCGSTMFSEAIKCSKRAQVLSEPPILNALLSPELDISDEIRMKLLRISVARMRGCRFADQMLTFIKTRSWNILRADLFEKCFPHSKALFIHRDTREILRSVWESPPGWLRGFKVFAKYVGATDQQIEELELGGIEHQSCFMIREFCKFAMNSSKLVVHSVDYSSIKQKFFELMERVWNTSFNATEFDEVILSFSRHSKSPFGSRLQYSTEFSKERKLPFFHPDLHMDIDDVRMQLLRKSHYFIQ